MAATWPNGASSLLSYYAGHFDAVATLCAGLVHMVFCNHAVWNRHVYGRFKVSSINTPI